MDRIVKRPIKGISKLDESKSDIASVRYKGFLTAGVERWKEYREQLENLQKKPILFIMMNSTEDADEIGDWLQTKYPNEFGGDKTLVIHTDNSGEVSKKDLDAARKTARAVDEDKCPVNAIVSVLMLREGSGRVTTLHSESKHSSGTNNWKRFAAYVPQYDRGLY
jgi:type III restriction enzyme